MNHFYPRPFGDAGNDSIIPPPPGFTGSEDSASVTKKKNLFSRFLKLTKRIKSSKALQGISWLVTLRPLRLAHKRNSQVNVLNQPTGSLSDLERHYSTRARADVFFMRARSKAYQQDHEGEENFDNHRDNYFVDNNDNDPDYDNGSDGDDEHGNQFYVDSDEETDRWAQRNPDHRKTRRFQHRPSDSSVCSSSSSPLTKAQVHSPSSSLYPSKSSLKSNTSQARLQEKALCFAEADPLDYECDLAYLDALLNSVSLISSNPNLDSEESSFVMDGKQLSDIAADQHTNSSNHIIAKRSHSNSSSASLSSSSSAQRRSKHVNFDDYVDYFLF